MLLIQILYFRGDFVYIGIIPHIQGGQIQIIAVQRRILLLYFKVTGHMIYDPLGFIKALGHKQELSLEKP